MRDTPVAWGPAAGAGGDVGPRQDQGGAAKNCGSCGEWQSAMVMIIHCVCAHVCLRARLHACVGAEVLKCDKSVVKRGAAYVLVRALDQGEGVSEQGCVSLSKGLSEGGRRCICTEDVCWHGGYLLRVTGACAWKCLPVRRILAGNAGAPPWRMLAGEGHPGGLLIHPAHLLPLLMSLLACN
eukprot:scaffold196976_cov22-Tisochrysis_lutea.AAC.2